MPTQVIKDIAARFRTVISQDTFTRANTTASTTISSGWGTPSDNPPTSDTWSSSGTATYQISGNEGTITQVATGTNIYALLGSGTSANAEALVRFSIDHAADIVGLLLRYTNTANHYRFRVTNTLLSIVLVNGGINTTLASANVTVTANTFYWLHARASGSSLFLKFWADGTAEPATWNLIVNDSTFLSAGQYGLFNKPSNTAHVASFDHFVVFDSRVDTLDTATRFRLSSGPKNHDVGLRFYLSATNQRILDIISRFRLGKGLDFLLRFLLLATRALDVQGRFRLSALKRVYTALRFLLEKGNDLALRFKVALGAIKDIPGRFKLLAQIARDIASRTPIAISQDTFTRTNSSGSWGTATNPGGTSEGEAWTGANGGGTLSIASNEGSYTGSISQVLQTLGSKNLSDAEFLVRFSVSATGDTAGIFFRSVGASNQYRVRYNNGNFQISLVLSGATTNPASTAFTVTPGSFYWIRARAAGGTISGKIWADGSAEPANWTLSLQDGTFWAPNTFGLVFKLAATTDVVNFDHFVVYDSPKDRYRDIALRFKLVSITHDIMSRFRLQAGGINHDVHARFNLTTPTQSNYGITLFVPNNLLSGGPPLLPAQTITDLQKLGSNGGTTTGNGIWLRYQLRWNGIERVQTSPPTYDWSNLDDAVTKCMAGGISLWFPVANAPTWYLTVNSDGSTGVPTDPKVQQNVLPDPAQLTNFAKEVAARYNGTTTNALHGNAQAALTIQCIQIGNEEFDTMYPRTSTALVPCINQAAPAIKSIYPNVLVAAGAVRNTPAKSLDHLTAWVTTLYVNGCGPNIGALDFHYYRDATIDEFGNFSPDPTVNVPATAGGGLTVGETRPSVGLELSTLQTVALNNGGFTPKIYTGETGWSAFDDGTCMGAPATPPNPITYVTQAQQATYIQDMYDAMRTGGGDGVFIFTMNSTSLIKALAGCAFATVFATDPKSITQTDTTNGNAYTYLQAFNTAQAYILAHPRWKGLLITQSTRDVVMRFKLQAVQVTQQLRDVATRFNLVPPPSGSIKDLSIYKEQMVMVYDPSGNFLGVWRDAPLLSGFKEAINAVPSPLTVKLPRPINNYNFDGTVATQNVVQYLLFGPGLPSTGLLRYQGKIDKIAPDLQPTGEETTEITLINQGSALADNAQKGTTWIFGIPGSPNSYIDPLLMMATFLPFPLTMDLANPGTSGNRTTFTFQGQTFQSIWNTCLLMLPSNWFYRVNADLSTTINVTPVTAQNTLVVGQHLNSFSYSQDWIQMKNDIYYQGGLVPNTSNTFYSATVTGADIATFGQRTLLAQDSRVNDNNTALVIANGYLALYDRPLYRTVLKVVDYRGGQASLGYDIETLKVGQSLQVIDPTVSPQFVSAVMPIVSINYLWDVCEIECGYLQPSQDTQLYSVYTKIGDFTLVH